MSKVKWTEVFFPDQTKCRNLKPRRWVDRYFVHFKEQFVLVFNNHFSSFVFSFRNVRALFHFSEWTESTDTLKCFLIRYKLISLVEEFEVLVELTGGHLIEFHLIESLDQNFSIKRLKIDQLIE